MDNWIPATYKDQHKTRGHRQPIKHVIYHTFIHPQLLNPSTDTYKTGHGKTISGYIWSKVNTFLRNGHNRTKRHFYYFASAKGISLAAQVFEVPTVFNYHFSPYLPTVLAVIRLNSQNITRIWISSIRSRAGLHNNVPGWPSTKVTPRLGANWWLWHLKLKLSLSQKVGCTAEIVTQSGTSVHLGWVARDWRTFCHPGSKSAGMLP